MNSDMQIVDGTKDPTSNRHGLIEFANASASLAQATTLEDIRAIRDKAEAARTYARSAQLGLDMQNHAAELKLRAERKAGQILAELRLRGGDRRSKRHRAHLKLDDLGVSKDQSKRWQRIASVPESEFLGYLLETRVNGGEVTSAALLRLSSRQQTECRVKTVRPFKSQVELRSIDESHLELLNHCLMVSNLLDSSPNAPIGLNEAQGRLVRRLLVEMYTIIKELTADLPRRTVTEASR